MSEDNEGGLLDVAASFKHVKSNTNRNHNYSFYFRK